MDWQVLSDKQISENLAIRLKNYRIHKHFTQKELAEKSGISINSIQNLEQGEMVSMRVLLAVLRILKLTNNIETLVPDISISPIMMLQLQKERKQRVKKAKD